MIHSIVFFLLICLHLKFTLIQQRLEIFWEKKIQIFYNDIAKKRDITNIMRLQADLEFQQKQIKKLMKSITLKYVAADYMMERHLALSK